jgi:electron transport complex protein RnfG
VIRLLAGVDVNGLLTGVTVLEHRETPGLGAQIAHIAYGESEPAFLAQFKGKTADGLVLGKAEGQGSVQAITGATISSQAVLNSVREGLEAFLKDRLVR